MLIAIMGGLASAALLTLCFVPALHAALWRPGRSMPVVFRQRRLVASD